MLRTKKYTTKALLVFLLTCSLAANTIYAHTNDNKPQNQLSAAVAEQLPEKENMLNSYLNSAQMGYNDGNPLTAVENFIKAENIIKNEPVILKNKYNFELGNFYSRYEQFENALSTYNDILTNNTCEKMFLYKQKAWYYNSLKRFNEAKKELDNLQNLINKEFKDNAPILFNFYVDYSYFLLDSYQFNEFIKEKTKLTNLITKMPEGENKIRAEIELNQLQITYFICKNMQDKALKILDENTKLAQANGINYKDNTTHFYKDYYNSIKDYKSVKEIIDKETEKTINQFGKNSVILMNSYENYINFYNQYNDNKNYKKYSVKLLALLEPYKNIIPLKYGNALKKAAEFKKDIGNNEEALAYLNEAERYYAKATSLNSYPFFDTNKTRGEVYKNMKKNDDALEYYTKAEKILNDLQGVYQTKDTFEIERDIAYVYANKNDYNNAIKRINSAIKTAEGIYTKNNVEVQKLNFNKVNILNQLDKAKEADEVIKAISIIVDGNQMEGYDYDFYFAYYMNMAYRSLSENNTDKAITYQQKAEKYAKNKDEKRWVKKLKSQIANR